MPTISVFYGITIKMYNSGEHNPPHFHAVYQGEESSFDMNGDLIKGKMPKNNANLLQLGPQSTKKSC